jgi:hypothetical protein
MAEAFRKVFMFSFFGVDDVHDCFSSGGPSEFKDDGTDICHAVTQMMCIGNQKYQHKS